MYGGKNCLCIFHFDFVNKCRDKSAFKTNNETYTLIERNTEGELTRTFTFNLCLHHKQIRDVCLYKGFLYKEKNWSEPDSMFGNISRVPGLSVIIDTHTPIQPHPPIHPSKLQPN